MLAGGAAVVPAAEAASPGHCRPSGSSLERVNRRAEVYRDRRGQLHACLRRTGERIDLATGDIIAYPRPAVRLKGTLVAFGADSYDGLDHSRDIILVDLKRWRDGRRYVAPILGFPATLRLVDSRTVVWMACRGGPRADAPRPRCRLDTDTTVSVYRHDRLTPEGEGDLLDESPNISVKSLRVRGSTVSWRNDGEVRKAPLR